jgi:hypothetical protein
MNSHGANHLVVDHRDARERHQHDGMLIDVVAIIAIEQVLLIAEHRAPQRPARGDRPWVGRNRDMELARGKPR